ncbi:MAG: nucleotidyltransferase domain-containing protein [Bacteroidales bacterium]
MHKTIGLQETDIKDILSTLCRNEKINRIILFGSRAKGSYATGSDIDLALSGDSLNTNDILDLSNDLEELELPYKFDLIILERIKEKDLLEHISRAGIVIYDKHRH